MLNIFIVCCSLSYAQGSSASGAVFNNLGTPLPFPSIRVCTLTATGFPCTPLATIYTDQTDTTTTANPFNGDAFGNFQFFGPAGWYLVQISGNGVTPYSYKVLLAADVAFAANGGSFAGVTSGANTTAAMVVGTGATLNVSGSGVINASQVAGCAISGSPSAGQSILANSASACVWGTPTSGPPLTSGSANPAASGIVRCSAGDTCVAFRNAGASGDVGITKNSSDQIVGVLNIGNIVFDAGACNNSTAAPGFDLPTSNAPAFSCNGSNVRFGELDFAAGGGTDLKAFNHFRLPATWSGAIDVNFNWFTSATTGNAIWQIQTGCAAPGTTVMTSGPALNTANTVSDTATGTANSMNTATITGITTTGCSAGQEMWVAVSRAHTDTVAASIALVSVELVVRKITQ